jgi:pyruvate formate lyase activating enzyme
MKFSGLQKTSLIDFPGKVASVLFTPGCNLHCPYCHNWQIATNPQPPFLQEGTAIEILESRKKFIDAVVISGGEPCMHYELPRFITKLKEHGFLVKLDTNGFYAEVLQECLAAGVDFVAMDVKTSLEKYSLFGATETANFQKSLELLKTGKVSYEFRMTVVPEIVTTEDIQKVAQLVKGAKTFALQQFVPKNTLDSKLQDVKPYSPEVISEFAAVLQKNVESIVLRL